MPTKACTIHESRTRKSTNKLRYTYKAKIHKNKSISGLCRKRSPPKRAPYKRAEHETVQTNSCTHAKQKYTKRRVFRKGKTSHLCTNTPTLGGFLECFVTVRVRARYLCTEKGEVHVDLANVLKVFACSTLTLARLSLCVTSGCRRFFLDADAFLFSSVIIQTCLQVSDMNIPVAVVI